jgi:hypothetical protein
VPRLMKKAITLMAFMVTIAVLGSGAVYVRAFAGGEAGSAAQETTVSTAATSVVGHSICMINGAKPASSPERFHCYNSASEIPTAEWPVNVPRQGTDPFAKGKG